jgi:HD-GYP domain-containing protein (c-di-GMP phosphodiesterase class II)
VREHQHAVRRIGEEYTSLLEHGRARLTSLRALVAEFLQRSAEDRDLCVCLGINMNGQSNIERHSLHVSMLAMAMGAAQGYDEPTLLELGLGCLLHDAGMLRLAGVDIRAAKSLSRKEYELIASHPLHTCELLREHVDQISPIARIVAYQMHERCNGSGYPRGRRGHQIHPLAKLAALADAYVALCSPRPHRPAMMPYYAVVTLLQEVRQGCFEPQAMRALLQTISLFPIGSYIDLGNNHIGKVLRTNANRYDRPVVELWSKDDLGGQPMIVNLLESPDAYPLRPIEAPRAY